LTSSTRNPAPRWLLAGAAAAFATVALAAPAGASAAPVGPSAADCATQVLSQPFLPWLDVASYTLPDGATFEDGAPGWNLNGDAEIGDSNESYFVNGAADDHSLKLPPGSSAVSSPICIGLGYPTMRFFARETGSALSLSTLRVEVRFRGLAGEKRSLYVGSVLGSSTWQPSLPVPVVVNLLTLLPDVRSPVSFAFTPVGTAKWRIDDVYVDPSARR
jgi:hypothetical protein